MQPQSQPQSQTTPMPPTTQREVDSNAIGSLNERTLGGIQSPLSQVKGGGDSLAEEARRLFGDGGGNASHATPQRGVIIEGNIGEVVYARDKDQAIEVVARHGGKSPPRSPEEEAVSEAAQYEAIQAARQAKRAERERMADAKVKAAERELQMLRELEEEEEMQRAARAPHTAH